MKSALTLIAAMAAVVITSCHEARGEASAHAASPLSISDRYVGCAMRRFGVSANGQYGYSFFQPARTSEGVVRVWTLDSGQLVDVRVAEVDTGNRPLSAMVGTESRQFGETGIVIRGNTAPIFVFDLATGTVTRRYPAFASVGHVFPNDQIDLYRAGWLVVPTVWAASGFERLDLATGEIDLISHEWPQVVDWRIAARGEVVTRTIRTEGGANSFQLLQADGSWRAVFEYPASRSLRVWVPERFDARSPPTGFWAVHNFVDERARLGFLRLADGEMENVGPEGAELVRLEFTPGRADLAWATFRTARGSLSHVFRTREARSLFNAISSNDRQVVVDVSEFSADGNVFAATIEGRNGERRAAIFRREGNRVREIVRLCAQPTLSRVAVGRPISLVASDGFSVHGYIYGRSRRPTANILYLHGGPRQASSRRYNPLFQYLVDRGYRILSLDYRGSAGHGAAYTAAGNGEYDSGMVSDVLAGGRWLTRDGCTRLRDACDAPIIVMGDSFGAYLAQAAVIREPDLFAGVVSLSGLSDLSDRQALTGRFARSEGTYLAEVLDFAGADSEGRLRRASPAGRVDEIRVPALYVHARDDDRVPFEQSATMVEHLVARGRRADLLAIPTGGHSLQCADCADVFYEGVGDFVDSVSTHAARD